MVVVEVVVACCCYIPYQLALMLALTFGPCVLTFAPCVLTFAPCILTFGPCACGAFLLLTGANISRAQVVVVTSCNLRWWCFFIQPLAQILHLHPGNLHCVVVVNDGGTYVIVRIWRWRYIYIYIHTPLELEQLAVCGGGLWWW